MNILCVFGRHAYGDPRRGEGYEYVNFVPAFRNLGHRVELFESFSREPYADFAALNRALLRRVEELSPDVVFCVLMQYEVWIETLRLIRRSGAWLVNWSTDDSWKYPMFSGLLAREFDLFVTTCPGLLERYHADGIDTVFSSQWAANANTLAPPLRADHCRFNVSFIGAAYGDRRRYVERLQDEGIDVACFGHGWPAGPIEAKLIPEIVRKSRVSLNFSGGGQSSWDARFARQIKARVFEVPGYGGCLLTEWALDLDRYFSPGEEVVVFEGERELVDQVKWLLAHPERRDEIARLGFERVCREHTYDQRFNEMLRELARRVPSRPQQAPEWPVLEEAVQRHRMNPLLRGLRAVLVALTSLIWGTQRGPRAARRFIFELSWRLRGRWVYTASGWPGRMFYRES